MNLSEKLLRMFGWTVNITVPDYPKAIICVAPHTSNWDFIIAKLAYRTVRRKSGFLMKSTWFFFPLGYIFKAMGGIPVVRKNKTVSLTEVIADRFNHTDKMVIAITPEGTRSRTSQWRTGFLRIAMQANVPIVLAVLDYKTKRAFIEETFHTSGDVDTDMAYIKNYYRDYTGKHPENFTTD